MYHSITIGEKNTWDDWHLIPASRPLFNTPPVKLSLIDIPGADGALDLTDVLAGRPTYGNRTGSWTFYVENGFKDWTVLYNMIMTYLHGKYLRAVLEDDPTFYYEGRFSVNQWKSEKSWSQIVIDYNVAPYKKYVAGNDDWLWDTFNFETGVIRQYKNLVVNGSLEVSVLGDFMDAIPVISSSAASMKCTYEGRTYTLSRGMNQFDDLIIHDGENLLTFTGNGTISIEIIGGTL
jgi:hypothetical protein